MAMNNMEEYDPSPYEEMNVIQARNNLELQKIEIRESAAIEIYGISNLKHSTIIEWCNMILEKGDVEANRWILHKVDND